MPQRDDSDPLFEPEIEREMTVRPLILPQFNPHIKAADLEDFEERDKKMLLALSLVEQKQDFTLEAQLLTNRQLRHVESELIRLRKSHGKISVQSAVVKWTGLTLGAGVMAAVIKRLVETVW